MKPIVVSECSVDFDLLPGQEIRYCDTCQQSVTDLSAMTELEAKRFLDRHGSDRCVSFVVEADGAMAFRPHRAALVPLRLRATVAAAGLSLAACNEEPAPVVAEPSPEAPAAVASAAPSAEPVPSAESVPVASATPSAEVHSDGEPSECEDTAAVTPPPTVGTAPGPPRIKRLAGKPVPPPRPTATPKPTPF